jgi:hypothetical protein
MASNVVKSYSAFRVNEGLLLKVLEAVKNGEVSARRYGTVRSFQVSYHGHREDLVMGTIYLIPAKLADNADDFPSALLYGQLVKELTPEVLADLYHQKIGESEFDNYDAADMSAIKDRLFKDAEGRYRTLVAFLPAWTTPSDLVVFKYVRKDDVLLTMLRHMIYNVYYDPKLSNGFDALSNDLATEKLDITDVTPKLQFPNLAEGQEHDFPELTSWMTGKTAGVKRAKAIFSAEKANEISEEFLEPGEKAVLDALSTNLGDKIGVEAPIDQVKQAGLKAEIKDDGLWVYPASAEDVAWLKQRGVAVAGSGAFKLTPDQKELVYPTVSKQFEKHLGENPELLDRDPEKVAAKRRAAEEKITGESATGLRRQPDYGEEGSYTTEANDSAEEEAAKNGKTSKRKKADDAFASDDDALAAEAEIDPTMEEPKADIAEPEMGDDDLSALPTDDAEPVDAMGMPPVDAGAPIDPMLPPAGLGMPDGSGQWKDQELGLIGEIADKANPEKSTWSQEDMRAEIRHAIDIIDTVRESDGSDEGMGAIDASVPGMPGMDGNVGDSAILDQTPITGDITPDAGMPAAEPMAAPVAEPAPIMASRKKVLAKDSAILLEVPTRTGKTAYVAVSRDKHVERVSLVKGKVAFAKPIEFPPSFRQAVTAFLIEAAKPKKVADVPLTTEEIFAAITEEIGPAPQVPTPELSNSSSTPSAPAAPARAKGESGNGVSPEKPVSAPAEKTESSEKVKENPFEKKEEKYAAFNLFVPGQVLQEFYPELQHDEVDYANDPHADLNPLELDRALDAQPEGGAYIPTDPAAGLAGFGGGNQQVLEGIPLRQETDIRGPGFSAEFYNQFEGIDPKKFVAATDVLKVMKKRAAPADYGEQFGDFMKKAIGEVAASFIAAFKATQRPMMSEVPGTGAIQFELMEQGLLANAANQIDVASRLRFLVGKLTDSQIQAAINDAWAQAAVWNTTEKGGFTYEVFVRAETLDQNTLVLKYSFVCGTKGL